MILALVLAGPFLAVVFSALLWCARPGTARAVALTATAVLAAASAFLLLTTDWAAASRVILIVDKASTKDLVERVNKVLDQLRKHGLAGYDLVVIGQDPLVEDKSLTNRAWRTQDWQPGDDLAAPTAEQAIRLAVRRLRATGFGERFWDTVCLRNYRVIVMATAPRSWDGQRLSVATLVTDLQQAGATLDLLLDPGEDPTPVLDILMDRPTLAPNDVPNPTVQFRLRLRSTALAPRSGASVQWKAECVLNEGNPDREKIFKLSHKGPGVVGLDGSVQVALPFARFEPALLLPRGFHLLSCRLQVELDGRAYLATQERYVLVREQAVMFVAGEGGRFTGEGGKDVLGDAWERVARYVGRWPPGVDFLGGPRPQWLNFQGEQEFLKSEPSGPRPLMVVLHDLSDAAWKNPKTKKLLEQWLAAGTHVLVSGAPSKPLEKDVPFLPAFAAIPENGPADGPAWQLDRRPRLIFVRDGSRLGRLPYEPSQPKELLEASGLAHLKFRSLGEALQTDLIEKVCSKLKLPFARAAGTPAQVRFPDPTKGFVQGGVLLATDLASKDPAADLFQPGAINDRLRCLQPLDKDTPDHRFVLDDKTKAAAARPLHEVGVNDVVVLFSFDDIQQPNGRSGALARLLRRGATVIHVRLRSPFLDGANQGATAANVTQRQKAYLDAEVNRLGDGTLFPGEQPLTAAEAKARFVDVGVLQLSASADSGLDAVATRVVTAIGPRFAPRSAVIVRHRLDRFLDERIGPALPEGERPEAKEAEKATAAPLRLQRLVPAKNGLVYASVVAPKTDDKGLAGMPLAVGALVGRGHILCLGYSLFEGATRTQLSTAEPFLGVRFHDYEFWPLQDRIFPRAYSDEIDLWGPQRAIDLAMFCADLEPSPTDQPQLRDIAVVDSRGRLRLECLVRLRRPDGKAVPLPPLQLTAKMSPRFRTLTPIDLDPARGRVYYELLPTESESLLGRDQRPADAATPPPGGVIVVEGVEVYLRGRELAEQPDLTGLTEAAAVASYSGGGEVGEADALPTYLSGTRVPAVLLFALALAVLWGWRALRRLLRWRTGNRLRRAESARSRIPDTEGLVAQAGESLGRPSSTLRAGAFAGFRTFEPGDRLELAVREDLVLSSIFNIPLIPRVPLRIDDRATRLVLVANVGKSMRLPSAGRGRPAPKVAAAALVVELLATLAWMRRAEVTLQLVGLDKPLTLGPWPASPGPSELIRAILKGAELPGRWSARLGLPGLDEGGGVVYVSDCLNEELETLVAAAETLEQDGGGAGAVLVSSPSEWHLLDLGYAPGAGVFCERSEWAPADLESAHRRFAESLSAAWDQTRGGLLPVLAGMTGEQILGAIRESRLLELLR